MNAHDRRRKAWCSFGVLALLAAATPADAQFTDALKKMADKAAQAAATASGQPDADAKPEQPPASDQTGGGDGGAKPAAASSGNVASVSTKFDFVPGDKVLFMDDFTQDELGEFPSRWSLSIGTFEVAEMDGERWLRCTARDGTIRMKLPAMAKLPCGFNWSMQHLDSDRRAEGVVNEVPEEDFLHGYPDRVDVGALAGR